MATPSAPALRTVSVTAAVAPGTDHVLALVQIDRGANGGGTTNVWDVPLDGGQPRSLVEYTRAERPLSGGFAVDLTRQLSPDARRLVLTDVADVAGRGILIVDLVAGTTVVIPTPDTPDEPAWSLDGRQIAYRGFSLQGPLQKESGLWVVDAAGGTSRRVWTSDVPAGSGATMLYGWTENGAGLAMTQNYQNVSVLDIATGAVKVLATAVHGIAWRNKRPSVVLARDQDVPLPSATGPRGAPTNVGRPGAADVRDTTFASPRILFEHPDVGTLLWAPRWSPATDEVLFGWLCGAGATCRDELVVVDAVTGARRVISTASTPYAHTWSANGKRIAYSDLSALHAMAADGSADREVFRPALAAGGVQPYITDVIGFAPR